MCAATAVAVARAHVCVCACVRAYAHCVACRLALQSIPPAWLPDATFVDEFAAVAESLLDKPPPSAHVNVAWVTSCNTDCPSLCATDPRDAVPWYAALEQCKRRRQHSLQLSIACHNAQCMSLDGSAACSTWTTLLGGTDVQRPPGRGAASLVRASVWRGAVQCPMDSDAAQGEVCVSLDVPPSHTQLDRAPLPAVAVAKARARLLGRPMHLVSCLPVVGIHAVAHVLAMCSGVFMVAPANPAARAALAQLTSGGGGGRSAFVLHAPPTVQSHAHAAALHAEPAAGGFVSVGAVVATFLCVPDPCAGCILALEMPRDVAVPRLVGRPTASLASADLDDGAPLSRAVRAPHVCTSGAAFQRHQRMLRGASSASDVLQAYRSMIAAPARCGLGDQNKQALGSPSKCGTLSPASRRRRRVMVRRSPSPLRKSPSAPGTSQQPLSKLWAAYQSRILSAEAAPAMQRVPSRGSSGEAGPGRWPELAKLEPPRNVEVRAWHHGMCVVMRWLTQLSF